MKKYLLLLPSLVLALLAGSVADAANEVALMSHVETNTALKALKTTAYTTVIRDGFTTPGDGGDATYTSSNVACPLNAGLGDNGSQVKPDSGVGCWLASVSDARQFGAVSGTRSFYTVTTNGTANVTLGGANVPSSCVNVCYITILGAGPYEQRYVGLITGGSGTAITVSPAPTLSMAAFSTIVYYGTDSAAAINAACAAGSSLGIGCTIPPGLYMIASGLTCPVANLNNYNVPPPLCGGSPGAVIMAVAAMPSMLSYGTGADYTQYIRNSPIPGNGMVLDCNFIATDSVNIPFSQETKPQDFQVKNCIGDHFHLGATDAPTASGAINAVTNKITRDIFYVPVSNMVCTATQPILTTTIDHGFASQNLGPTYRVATLIGFNNVPSPGPIEFIAESTGARTLKLHNIDCTAWVAFAGTALIALTMPSTPSIDTVFAVSAANPAVITTTGNLNRANGDRVCLYGIGGTGTLTGVPDGCYPIKGVAAVGADGATQFSVPVDTTGYVFTGGGIVYQEFQLTKASFTGAIGPASTKLTVSAVSSGTLKIGQQINDASSGVTAVTYITGSATFSPTLCAPNCTGAGGTGTYAVNNSQTVVARALSSSIPGDVGFHMDNLADAQFIANDVNGTAYPFYANKATSGYDGKYIANHVWVGAEQGWLLNGHDIGGNNSLIGEQCDAPIVYCARFVGSGNSSLGSNLNGSFSYVKDGGTWMYRLESAGDLTADGGSIKGYSVGLRVNEFSSYALRGNQSISAAQSNYRRMGVYAPVGAFVLYGMQDNSGSGVSCPAGVPSVLFQTNGGIVVHC